MGEDQLILAGEGVEFVEGGDKPLPGEIGNLPGHPFSEALRGVQPGADGRTPQRQLPQTGERQLQHLTIPLQAGTPAGNFLGEGNRDGVLQVGSAGLHRVAVLRLQMQEGLHQSVHGGDHPILNGVYGGNVHGGGKGVVGGLAHVDVVVGMHQFSPRQRVGAVCDHLIGIHVGLGAGAGLPDHQGEVGIQRPGNDLARRLFYGAELFGGHFLGLQGMVGPGRRQLENPKGMYDLRRHGFQPHADGEIFMAALGLGAPVFVGGNPDFSHRVMLDTVLHIFLLPVGSPPCGRAKCTELQLFSL